MPTKTGNNTDWVYHLKHHHPIKYMESKHQQLHQSPGISGEATSLKQTARLLSALSPLIDCDCCGFFLMLSHFDRFTQFSTIYRLYIYQLGILSLKESLSSTEATLECLSTVTRMKIINRLKPHFHYVVQYGMV